MMTTRPLPVNAGQTRDRAKSSLCRGKAPGYTSRYSVIGTTNFNSEIISRIIPLGSFRTSAMDHMGKMRRSQGKRLAQV
jgi:hypothetical protein